MARTKILPTMVMGVAALVMTACGEEQRGQEDTTQVTAPSPALTRVISTPAPPTPAPTPTAAPAATPTAAPPAPTPTQGAVSRQQSIQIARRAARSWGEPNPAIIEVVRTTVEDANKRAAPGGLVRGRTALQGNRNPAWLVGMRGQFLPESMKKQYEKAGLTPRPVEGRMYLIIEINTGKVLAQGLLPGNTSNS